MLRAPSSRIISTSMPSRRPRSATRSRGQRKRIADRIENGAAGQHQVGALDADAIIAGAFLVAHAEQPLDHGGDVGIVHPDAVDPPAIVACEIEMNPGERRHGARRAQHMHVAQIRAVFGRERRDILRDVAHHLRIGFQRYVPTTEMLGQRDDAERIDIHALIRGGAFDWSGSRSIRTSSVEPPPMSNRMAPRPFGSSSGEQPITASVASVSRSITSSRMPVSVATRARNCRHWRPRGRPRLRSAAGAAPCGNGSCRCRC